MLLHRVNVNPTYVVTKKSFLAVNRRFLNHKGFYNWWQLNSTCMGLKLSMVKVNLEIGCFAKINMQILEWDNGSFMQSKIDIKCPLPRDIFYCKCFFKKLKKPGEPNPTLESYALDQGRKVTLRKLRFPFCHSNSFSFHFWKLSAGLPLNSTT